jgi:fatty acid desaturase
MPTNDAVQNLMENLIACDEQPSEEEMTELRQRLEQKVTRMKRRGRHSLYVCLAAAVLMLLGYLSIVISASGRQDVTWLTVPGFSVLIAGAILAIVGCIGLLLFRGFGYVWARHDFQETAIMELSLHVQRLSERVNELSKNSPSA